MRTSSLLSDGEALALENSSPADSNARTGTRLQEAQAQGLVVQEVVVSADATGGKSFTADYSMKIVDVLVQCNAANVGGALQLRRGTDTLTDHITCAVNHVVTRAGTLDDAFDTLTAGETLNVRAKDVADRGTMRIVGYRV